MPISTEPSSYCLFRKRSSISFSSQSGPIATSGNIDSFIAASLISVSVMPLVRRKEALSRMRIACRKGHVDASATAATIAHVFNDWALLCDSFTWRGWRQVFSRPRSRLSTARACSLSS